MHLRWLFLSKSGTVLPLSWLKQRIIVKTGFLTDLEDFLFVGLLQALNIAEVQ
jgi:hypothetical protein